MNMVKIAEDACLKIEPCGGMGAIWDERGFYYVTTRCEVPLYPESRVELPLGFKLSLPKGMCALILPRADLSRRGFIVSADMGDMRTACMIDADVLPQLVFGGEGEVCATLRVSGGNNLTFFSRPYSGLAVPRSTRVAIMKIIRCPEIGPGGVCDDEQQQEGGVE